MSKIRPVYRVEGKRLAKDFATFLNLLKTKDSTEYLTLASVIDDLNNLATGRVIGFQQGGRRFRKDPPLEGGKEWAGKVLKLGLRKYPLFAEFEFRNGKLNVSWITTSAIDALIHEIIGLAERGLLLRVRRCERCGDWFYAKRSRTWFCKKMCAKLHWQSSEAGKEKRREYIRTYMRKYRKKYS